MDITVSGFSDDLIEVEGDLNEEFHYQEDRTNYLGFSDGTLLDVKYDENGIWRIHKLSQGSCVCELTQGTDIDTDYSDKMHLVGADPARWVVFGVMIAKSQSVNSH